MMKQKLLKRTALTLSLLLLTVSLTGRAGTLVKNTSGKTNTPSTSNEQTIPDNTQSEQYTPPENEMDFPGSYTVPEGWVKVEKYSTKDKTFYVEEDHKDDELPDNISIEVGTNRYSADEHEKFRDAILRQLTMQLQGVDGELTGDGTYTEQDYILYIFTISETDVETKQYYIVGDHRYCLIQLTNFTGSESVGETAQAMAESFVWD